MGAYNIDININTGNVTTSINGVVSSMKDLDALVAKLNGAMGNLGAGNAGATEKAAKSIADYSGSYKTLSKDIENTRNALLNEIKALEDLRKVTTTADAAMDKQVQTVKDLEKQLKSQTTALKQYSAVSKEAKTSSISLMNGLNQVAGAFGISAGIYGAVFALKGIIKTVADFDLAQKKLQSILAETDSGMKSISESAISVGKNSIFGAKGVTELQIELAKMGFTKQEIIAMQGAIVNLATATQEELAPSAEVVANILRAFNLTAADATMVVDVMGKAFNDSALDLSNFRESIKYVAPIAKQANFTFAETTSLLEQLSNAGIKGSLAGTGLTNIISRLGNENSKFVKTLGRTVNGFDDFLAALVELKSRGANLTDIFQLVDRRAAATFTILLDGVSTVEEFRKKLEESAGTMEKQAAVQLDSITYKATLLKESWKSMIIEMDDSTNVITKLAKWFLTLGQNMVSALGDPSKQVSNILANINTENSNIENLILGGFVKLSEAERQIYDEKKKRVGEYYVEISDLETRYQKQVSDLTKIGEASGANMAIPIASAKIEFGKQLKEIQGDFEGVNEMISSLSIETTNKALKPYVDEFVRLTKETKNLDEAWLIQVSRLSKLRDAYPKASLNAQIYQKAIAAVTAEYDKLNKTGLNIPSATTDKELSKRLAQEKSILEIKKKIALEDIKSLPDFRSSKASPELIQLINDDIEKKRLLTQSYSWDEIIRKQDYDSAIKIAKLKGEDTSAIINAYNLNKELFAKTFNNEMLKLEQDYADKSLKITEGLRKENWEKGKKSFEDQAKQRSDAEKYLADQRADAAEKAFKYSQEHSIANFLGIPEDQLDFAVKGFETIQTQVSGLADAWVESAGRIVDARNNMVQEGEQALQTEIQLAELGFASNVTLKRQELEKAKQLRKEALDDQKRAQKVQLAIDTATQLSSQATAVANYFASTSKIPIVGVLLAIAAATTMFASMQKYKALAKEQSAVQYETGGWVGGLRHTQGGTNIEAEKGEFVINRKSAAKHSSMIEAINNDDTITMNKMYINGLKNGVLKTSVSLDDSEDLKAIRKALERGGGDVYIQGNYRIERKGNTITKVRLN